MSRLIEFSINKGIYELFNLLGKAQEHLPMPQKAVTPDAETTRYLWGALYKGGGIIRTLEHPEEVRLWSRFIGSDDLELIRKYARYITPENASRAVANILAVHSWRNSIIEDFHAGRRSGNYRPYQKRFTKLSEQKLIRNIAGGMGAIAKYWPELFSDGFSNDPVPTWPKTASALSSTGWYSASAQSWSLIDQSSEINLYKD